MTDMETRLAKLERENRWMKRIGALVVLVAGVATVMGMAYQDEKIPDVVKAKKFVLVDADGKQKASLDTAEESVIFMLGSVSTKGTVTLYVSKNESKIDIAHLDAGLDTIQMSVDKDLSRFLLGTPLLGPSVTVDKRKDKSSVSIQDKKGEDAWKAPK